MLFQNSSPLSTDWKAVCANSNLFFNIHTYFYPSIYIPHTWIKRYTKDECHGEHEVLMQINVNVNRWVKLLLQAEALWPRFKRRQLVRKGPGWLSSQQEKLFVSTVVLMSHMHLFYQKKYHKMFVSQRPSKRINSSVLSNVSAVITNFNHSQNVQYSDTCYK